MSANSSKQDRPSVSRLTFCKDERLSNRKVIGQIFTSKNSIKVDGITLRWLFTSELKTTYAAQAMFAVPARTHKKANQRNTHRRRLKEAYRQLKGGFYADLGEQNQVLALAIVYTSNKEIPYLELESKLKDALSRLINKMR